MAISMTMKARAGAPNIRSSFSATKTSSDTTTAFQMADYVQATIMIKTTDVAGTSPTLNVYVQKQLPDGSTYQDIASFTQITSNTTRVMHLSSGGNLEEGASDGALAAGTINGVPFGGLWRLKLTIGGTSPSFGIACYIEAQ